MAKLKRLIMISRPISWIAFMSVYWWGLIIAGNNWNYFAALGFIYFGAPMCLLVFGLNDIADRQSDEHNPRKGKWEGAVLTELEPGLVIKLSALLSLPVIIFFTISGHFLSAILILLTIALAFLYSFEPVRLKSRPLIDSLSNGIWLTAIMLSGYYVNSLEHTFKHLPWRVMIVFFLSATAFHALATIYDYEADRRAGDRTISQLFGKRLTAILAATSLLVCVVLANRINYMLYYFYLACFWIAVWLTLNPGAQTMQRLKKLFLVLILIPLPAVYLLIR